ncbi:MAG TPA: hypothetical protein VFN41_10915 [Candidatus Limnocylindrales bacterium]|nr:hypothetical protein [Candidatus Limnocylindrales bacterium]
MTRRDVLRDAGRTLLLGMSGWLVGALLIARFATGALVPDLDLVYLCVVLWVAVPVAAIAGARLLQDGSVRRPAAASRTSLVWGVIAVATCAALVDTTRVLAEGWSTMQVWLALALLTPFGVAVGTVPQLLRSEGRSRSVTAVSGRVRFALVAGALGIFAIALLLSDTLLSGASVAAYSCDASVSADICAAIQPTQPILGSVGWVLVGAFAVAALVAFAVDLNGLAGAAVGILYLAGAFWVRYPWGSLIDGTLTVTSPAALVASHAVAASALIVAVAFIQLFREPGGSETERELTAWLRAEAFLPEQRSADGKAAS